MKNIKADRHGEIAFEKITKAEMPKDIKASEDVEFMRGSHGNPHGFKGGLFYPYVQDDFIFGYFCAEDTILTHPEHGDRKVGTLKQAKLPNGYYRLRRAVETINEEMKPVVD